MFSTFFTSDSKNALRNREKTKRKNEKGKRKEKPVWAGCTALAHGRTGLAYRRPGLDEIHPPSSPPLVSFPRPESSPSRFS
jgi:hypothetical protein